MAYQYQHGHGHNGSGSSSGGANDEKAPASLPVPVVQSQYFQSYDVSHLTQLPVSRVRPKYTPQQKADAIRLLNEGTPTKTIAQGIGGSCSLTNPYRWRAEVRERQLRAEAERRERERQRQLARALRVQAWRNNFNLFMQQPANQILVSYLACALVEIIACTQIMNSSLSVVWLAWKFFLTVLTFMFILPQNVFMQLYMYSLVILWACIIFGVGNTPIM